MDTMRWWLDWLEAAARAATAAVGGAPSFAPPGIPSAPGAAPNPFASFFGNPFAGAMPGAMPNPLDLWRRWLEALPLLALNPFASQSASQPKPGASATASDPFGVAGWWRAWLAASATPGQMPGAAPGAMPGDPWIAFRQWYERASAAVSGPLEEWLRSDAFARASGAFWESAATATAAGRRAAETQLAALGMASRADVARVASLVVQVEAKVDGITEALEDAQDAQDARGTEAIARVDALAALERRVERMEAKLDRLLAALEPPERGEIATAASPPNGVSTPASAPEPAAPGIGNGAGKPTARTHKPSTTRTRRKPPSGK